MATQKVIIASLNPAKITAVESAFTSAFPDGTFEFVGVNVPSEVADQPMSDSETHLGALNRVRNAKDRRSDGAFYVGLEAGIDGNDTDFSIQRMPINGQHCPKPRFATKAWFLD